MKQHHKFSLGYYLFVFFSIIMLESIFFSGAALAVVSLIVLGIGVAITGVFPGVLGLYVTTVIMSVGFHYLETGNQSLSLQWLKKETAAQNLDEIPRVNRDFYLTDVELPEIHQDKPMPQVDLRDILFAFKDAMARADMYSHHHIQREALSVRERMSHVLSALKAEGFTNYTSLFSIEEGRRGVVVTLLAILELVKEQLIDLVQSEAFAPIHIKTASSSSALHADKYDSRQ